MEKSEKIKAIKLAKEKLDKDYGKGTVMTLSEKADVDLSNIIPTGSIGLDNALGIGGLLKGRIIEIIGRVS